MLGAQQQQSPAATYAVLRAKAELELRRRYAPERSDFLRFVTTTKPDMKINFFHRLLCKKLDKFLDDVIAGKQPRLMVVAPPRHGKTELVSRRFPAYAFGKFPKMQMIACSYAADLAMRNNRDVQRVMESPIYQRIFRDTRLGGENIATLSGKPLRNSSIFEIVEHLGAYRAAGVGVGITGMGFDIGIIDDPVKDAQQANSEKERETIWEWYQSTFYSRAMPNSGILLIMTRWHEADLAGKLLHAAQYDDGDQWEVVRFPAIAEEDELDEKGKLLRKEGEALHPDRYPIDRLKRIRSVAGSYSFAALYQGRPIPKGGGIVSRDDFRFYRKADLERLLQTKGFDLIVLSTDAAFKDADTSSYVVTQVWGRRGTDSFLLEQDRERRSFTSTLKSIEALKARYPNANAVLIEDKANGPAIVDVLTKKIPGVIPVEPLGSKEARAEAAAPLIEAHNVWLPDPQEQPWVELFIHEWLSVPTGAYWDQVDASGQYMLKYGRFTPVDLEKGSAVSNSTTSQEKIALPQSSEERDSGPWALNQ